MRRAQVSTLRRLLDDALWGPESPARLDFVRRALVVLIAIRAGIGPYQELARLPDALFDPVPILAFQPSMPSRAVIAVVQIAVAAAAALVIFRKYPRAAFAVAWAGYLFVAALWGSRGKVVHNDLLLLWAAAPFLVAPTVDDAKDTAPSRRTGWPVRVSIVVIALIYAFAGYHKLRRSGPSWVYGENMEWVMLWGPAYGAPGLKAVTDWVGSNPVAARMSAAFIIGLELVFPLAIWHRRLRPAIAIAAIVLHAGTWVLLGLDYWAWAATVAIVLIDWPALARSRR
jgi:hypothetical protein